MSKANLNVFYIINMMFRDRDVPEAIWKSTDNGFKTNNKFGKKKNIQQTHSLLMLADNR